MERSRYSIDAPQADARRISHGGSFQTFQPVGHAQQNHSKNDLTLASASFFADTGICAAVVAMFLAPLIAIALY